MSRPRLFCVSWMGVGSGPCEVPGVVVTGMHPGGFVPGGHFWGLGVFVLGLVSAGGGVATAGGPYGMQPGAPGCFRV